jgi:hypothetical protein
MFRGWIGVLFFLGGMSAGARAADMELAAFRQVEIAPTKTSIYIGTVSMSMPVFTRTEARYESSYVAKVFPFFFYNEAGRLAIEVSDAQLAALARGEPIEFTGRGRRDDGTERRIEGKATPADARSGKVKVRVFVSKSVELIFNTTYRFAE